MKTKLSILVIAVFLLLGCVHLGTPEVGEHVGYITETGYGGLIWQTHSIKLVDSHFSVGGDSSYQSYWLYGINEGNPNNINIFDKANIAKNSNALVNVRYSCSLIVPYWQASDACIIIDITNANQTN